MTASPAESRKGSSVPGGSLDSLRIAVRRSFDKDFALSYDLAAALSTWNSINGLVKAKLPESKETDNFIQVGPISDGDNGAISALFYYGKWNAVRLLYVLSRGGTGDKDQLMNELLILGGLVFRHDSEKSFMRAPFKGLDALVQITVWDIPEQKHINIETIATGQVKKIPKIVTLDPDDIEMRKIVFPETSYIYLPRTEEQVRESETSIALNSVNRAGRILQFTHRQVREILDEDAI